MVAALGSTDLRVSSRILARRDAHLVAVAVTRHGPPGPIAAEAGRGWVRLEREHGSPHVGGFHELGQGGERGRGLNVALVVWTPPGLPGS
jgi:hypothetical protein